ncbi:MAG: hypothetical protein PHC44_03850 [Lutispora sp.]|nr:hypothetical protein [Lutispora sp.]MDD4833851.1 hypothetical protein [Lutispora sp.]
MSNPLMRVMFNSTIDKPSTYTSEKNKHLSPSNIREEEGKLLKEILAKNKSDTVSREDNLVINKKIKLITLEELKEDFQRVELIEEKKETKKESKNLVSLASIGKLYREVK